MQKIGVALAVGMMLLASSAVAQDANPLVFGMYYRCNQAREAQADDVVWNVLGPIAQKHVDAGDLSAWGWLSHRQGGAWRKGFFTVGTDRDVMMDVRGQIFQEFLGEHTEAAAEMNTACPSHDDYIWTGIATSPLNPDAPLGQVSISTYYACDMSREDRTNEIFEEVLAPLYQKHMDLGHVASWGFYAHRSGGRFRRLETFSGADHKTLLNMQDAIFDEAFQTNALAMQEFYQICDSHTDYMWANTTQQ